MSKKVVRSNVDGAQTGNKFCICLSSYAFLIESLKRSIVELATTESESMPTVELRDYINLLLTVAKDINIDLWRLCSASTSPIETKWLKDRFESEKRET